MARGGQRQPQNPAPVSAEGNASARTDGGPGSESQPLRVPTGLPYGEAGQLRELQQSAPLATGSGGAGSAAVASAGPVIPPEGIFGPTTRPGESPLAGVATRGSEIAGDVDGFLRILYQKFPHPAIAALIRKDR